MAIESRILSNAHRAMRERNFNQLDSAKRLLQILDEEKTKGFIDYPESKLRPTPEDTRKQIQTFPEAELTDQSSSINLLMNPDQSISLTLAEFLKMRRRELSLEARARGESRVSQETLARKARMSLAWYQKIEQGKMPRVHLLLEIATSIGLNEDQKEVFMKRFSP